MLRTLIVSGAVAAGLILAPGISQAKVCDNHGTGPGQMYVTACANGDGGSGPNMRYWDREAGKYKFDHRDNMPKDSRLTPGGPKIH